MSPNFVQAYVKNNKNDSRNAEAICEAVQRPTMRFVAFKSPAQPFPCNPVSISCGRGEPPDPAAARRHALDPEPCAL